MISSEARHHHRQKKDGAGTGCDGLPLHQRRYSQRGFPKAGRENPRAASEASDEVQNPCCESVVLFRNDVIRSGECIGDGPAKYPTFEQIKAICEAALQSGIRHLDMYGYRIGNYLVTDENWPLKRPPAKGSYPLTDPFPGKYLYDRPELLAPLGKYLLGLKQQQN